jgi:hypothetical protein
MNVTHIAAKLGISYRFVTHFVDIELENAVQKKGYIQSRQWR